jgi:Resolvase, N terminal domain
MNELPAKGSMTTEMVAKARAEWAQEARKTGIDLSAFNPDAPLAERLAWAPAANLIIAGILSRFSTDLQQSTETQVVECLRFAARHGLYVPPEFICVDEAVSGRKSRRDGLDRMRLLLDEKLVGVLLVFKVSRLLTLKCRSACRSSTPLQAQLTTYRSRWNIDWPLRCAEWTTSPLPNSIPYQYIGVLHRNPELRLCTGLRHARQPAATIHQPARTKMLRMQLLPSLRCWRFP